MMGHLGAGEIPQYQDLMLGCVEPLLRSEFVEQFERGLELALWALANGTGLSDAVRRRTVSELIGGRISASEASRIGE